MTNILTLLGYSFDGRSFSKKVGRYQFYLDEWDIDENSLVIEVKGTGNKRLVYPIDPYYIKHAESMIEIYSCLRSIFESVEYKYRYRNMSLVKFGTLSESRLWYKKYTSLIEMSEDAIICHFITVIDYKDPSYEMEIISQDIQRSLSLVEINEWGKWVEGMIQR